MGLKDCFGLLRKEEFLIPEPSLLQEYIFGLEKKLLEATGSEYTKLIYTLANAYLILNMSKERHKSSKKGKWVWIND